MREALDHLAAVHDRGRAAYLEDALLQLAAQRALEILGEAAKTVSSRTVDANAGVPWSQLARTRDLIAHHYHRVDVRLVWQIIEQQVEPLRLALDLVVVDDSPG